MSTGKKLRLGPLPKLESTKMTFACPASLRADLDRYAALHAQTYGEAVDAATLIPHMLEAFMAGDRGFKRTHAMNGKAAPRELERLWIGARGRNRTGTPFGEGFSSHFDFRRRPTQRRAFVVWSTPSP